MTVLVASRWASNAHLLADVARLGYLRTSDVVLDPTFGLGSWWKIWRPDTLITHDLELDGVNFTALPEDDDSVDAVAFDPPYVCVGGRSTTGIAALYQRYGMINAPRTPAELQVLINRGLAEMTRVVRPGGTILVKCANYVSSGKLWPGTHLTWVRAHELGLVQLDELHHVSRPRPQPLRSRADGAEVRQQHARSNTSVLLVFQKKRTPRKRRPT